MVSRNTDRSLKGYNLVSIGFAVVVAVAVAVVVVVVVVYSFLEMYQWGFFSQCLILSIWFYLSFNSATLFPFRPG